jgi:hypothetical protein
MGDFVAGDAVEEHDRNRDGYAGGGDAGEGSLVGGLHAAADGDHIVFGDDGFDGELVVGEGGFGVKDVLFEGGGGDVGVDEVSSLGWPLRALSSERCGARWALTMPWSMSEFSGKSGPFLTISS